MIIAKARLQDMPRSFFDFEIGILLHFFRVFSTQFETEGDRKLFWNLFLVG